MRARSLATLPLAAGAGLAAALAARRALHAGEPPGDGALRLGALDAPVEVLRDIDGVPHVYAESERDAAVALGFVHAQERLVQMELTRRLGHGRLAELAGPAALGVDRYVRVIGLGRAARAEAASLDDGDRGLLEAYAAGVDAWTELGRLPWELRALRIRPEPWAPADSLVVAKWMALALGQNFEGEIVRARLRDRLGAERAAAIEPLSTGPTALAGPSLPPGAAEAAADAARARRAAGGGPGAGSNNWAVAAWRSASGGALLANDPHLMLNLPPVWFANHLSYEGHSVAGLSLPGAPGVVIGHNGRVAWGFTNTMADTQDLFEERFDEHDPLRYAVPGGSARCQVVREEIRVRGRRRPHVEEVRITRHGPVVAPALADAGGRALALGFTALEAGGIVGAVRAMNVAPDADALVEAARSFAGPVQNLVFADASGAIGLKVVGGPLPRRPRGQGLVPVDGASGDDDWQGRVAYDDLPALRDPPCGYVVTANNRIAEDGPFVSAEWLNGYRAQRIAERLDALELVSLEDCCRIQCDVRSLPGLQLQAIASRYEGSTPGARAALRLLADWDGELSAESAGGAVYAVLIVELTREAHSDVAGELDHLLGRGFCELAGGLSFLGRATPALLDRLERRDDAWLPGERTWDEVFDAALAQAVGVLQRELGPDPARWRWGDLHRLELDHPLAALPPLRRWLRRGPFPLGGDADTVAQAFFAAWKGWGGQIGGPSARLVVDLADPDAARFVLPGGQSGHVGSPRFDDQIEDWLAGRTRPLRYSREAVERGSAERTTLIPTSERSGGT